MRRSIMYTRHDGGVSLCEPTREALAAMQGGGIWREMPHGFVDEQVNRQISSGIAPDHAAAFARAMGFGGCTEGEAWAIIRDRDCARHGSAFEIVDERDLPSELYRDAWRRGHNGGPPYVSMDLARPIHWRRVIAAVEAEERRRRFDLTARGRFVFGAEEIRRAIKRARDEDELARIWPEGLPSC